MNNHRSTCLPHLVDCPYVRICKAWPIAAAITAVLSVYPRHARGDMLVPPPALAPTTTAERYVAAFFAHYYARAIDPDFCILADTSARAAFRRVENLLPSLQIPHRFTYARYFHRHLAPAFAPSAHGVEGMGTYAELIARRDRTIAKLQRDLPRGPASTRDEIINYATTERRYLEQVQRERDWVNTLIAAGACIRRGIARDVPVPGINGFAVFRSYWVDDEKVRARLREQRRLVLPMLTADQHGAQLLMRRDTAWDSATTGAELQSIASAIAAIDAEDSIASSWQLWIPHLEPTESAALRDRLSDRLRIRSELASRFDLVLAQTQLPDAVEDDKAQTYLSRLAVAKGTRNTRVIGQVARVRDHRHPKASSTGPATVADTFAFAVIRNGAPSSDWPPGLGLRAPGGLCYVQPYVAIVYRHGEAVPIGKWQVNAQPAYPVACGNEPPSAVASSSRWQPVAPKPLAKRPSPAGSDHPEAGLVSKK